jgi:putative transcriptional regulator
MIRIRLREVMEAYEARTGERVTYARLAETTGLARSTIESMGARPTYNATLEVIDRLCTALACSIQDLLEQAGEDENTCAPPH